MKKFITLFLFLGVITFAHSQCSITGPSPVTVPSNGVTKTYSISGGPNAICTGNVQVDWLGPSLGTIKDKSCTGFKIDFTPQDGTTFIRVRYTSDPPDGPPQTIECTKAITTMCDPNVPIFTASGAECGASDIVEVNFATNNEVNTFMFSNFSNFTLSGSGKNGTNVRGTLQLIDPCEGGSFNFQYTNDCGSFSQNYSISLDTDKFVGLMSGNDDICIQFGPVTERYRVDVDDYASNCISVQWSVSPSTGASVVLTGEDGSSPYADIQFTQDGRYTVTATAIACGETLSSKVRTREVVVCDDIAFLPGSPPLELQNVCFDDFGTCYDFSGFCFSDLIINSNDPKLLAGLDGTVLCLYDILGTTRTSTITITPVNACGQGQTRTWTININPPKKCGKGGFEFLTDDSAQEFIFDQNVISFFMQDHAPESEMQVQVFDMMGRTLMNLNARFDQRRFELPADASGILIANIVIDGVRYTEKFYRNNH